MITFLLFCEVLFIVPMLWVYFLPHIGLVTVLGLSVMYGLVFVLKMNVREQLARAPLLSLAIFLTEVSCCYLAYTNIDMTRQWLASLFAVMMILAAVASRDISELISKRIVFVLFVFMAVCSTIAYFSIKAGMATATQSLVGAFAVVCSAMYPDFKRICVAYAVTVGLLVVVYRELGYTLVISLVMLALMLIHADSKGRLWIARACAGAFLVWSVLFTFYNKLFVFMYSPGMPKWIKTAAERTFFYYPSVSQTNLIYDIYYDKKNVLLRALSIFALKPYREIVPFENGNNTSSADYLYISMSNFFMLGSVVTTVCFVSVYVRKLFELAKTALFIPMATIAFTAFVHVFANLSVMPFTGIPLPFLSYSPLQMFIFTLLAVFINKYEDIYNDSYKELYKRKEKIRK